MAARRPKRVARVSPSRAASAGAPLADVVQRVLRQEAALYRVVSLAYQPFESRLREILRLDAVALDVARVSFWALRRNPDALHCEALYLLTLDRYEAGG